MILSRRFPILKAALTKGPLLPTKWVKNRVFVGGLRGWGSKSPLFGSKRSTFGGFRTSPDLILATGLPICSQTAPNPCLNPRNSAAPYNYLKKDNISCDTWNKPSAWHHPILQLHFSRCRNAIWRCTVIINEKREEEESGNRWASWTGWVNSCLMKEVPGLWYVFK